VCPHLAAWLHMLSTLAIKVEPCALCSYYVLLQNIKMISSSTTLLFEEETVQITDLLSEFQASDL